MNRSMPIPDDVLIPAIEATRASKEFSECSVDNWGEAEKSYCRKLCGEEFMFVETDWIGKRAINIRKSGRLKKINGHQRRALTPAAAKYAEYLQSTHWQEFRLKILAFWDYKCCLCFRAAKDVHHRTYSRVGMELETDCVALCRECHVKVHGAMPDGNNIFNSQGKESLFRDF